MALTIKKYLYPIYLKGATREQDKFLGTAFPVTPNGGLLTCRHVVDTSRQDGEGLAVVDGELRRMVSIEEIQYPEQSNLDIAFIPNALQREKEEFLPILSPDRIMMGNNVYTCGYFKTRGAIDVGYFKGHIVNFSAPDGVDIASMSVSYAVVEGLSGSPVLTYHNGPKVVGLCYGNTQSRIVASEVLEYEDEQIMLKETINRILELGQAYPAGVLARFLNDAGVRGYMVSARNVPGLSFR